MLTVTDDAASPPPRRARSPCSTSRRRFALPATLDVDVGDDLVFDIDALDPSSDDQAALTYAWRILDPTMSKSLPGRARRSCGPTTASSTASSS